MKFIDALYIWCSGGWGVQEVGGAASGSPGREVVLSGLWEGKGNDPCSRASQFLLDSAHTAGRARAWEGSLESGASGRPNGAVGGFPGEKEVRSGKGG